MSVIPLFMVLLGLEAKRHAERQWDRLSGLAAAFYDLLQGLPTLRAFNRARAGRRTLEKAAEDFRVTTMSTLRIAFLSSLALEVLAAVGTALVALFLGLRLLDGSLHLAVGLAVLVLAPEVYLPLRRAASEFHASTAGQAAADRILDILDEPRAGRRPVRARPARAPSRRAGPGRARPEHAYGCPICGSATPTRAAPVLDGLNLDVAFGEHVAVTGESGSGKSTLLAVILGFVIPSAGRLTRGRRRAGRPAMFATGVGRSRGYRSAPTSSAGPSPTTSRLAGTGASGRLSPEPRSSRACQGFSNDCHTVSRPRSVREA